MNRWQGQYVVERLVPDGCGGYMWIRETLPQPPSDPWTSAVQQPVQQLRLDRNTGGYR